MFKQAVDKGFQKELPDIWLTDGNPWEVKRSEIKYEVCFGGRTEKIKQGNKEVTVWKPAQKVIAQAYDNPIPGFRESLSSALFFPFTLRFSRLNLLLPPSRDPHCLQPPSLGLSPSH